MHHDADDHGGYQETGCFECNVDGCDEVFLTPGARNSHMTVHSRPYHREEILRELYWEEGLTMLEIAEIYEVEESTIGAQMDNNDIERRSPVEAGELAFADD